MNLAKTPAEICEGTELVWGWIGKEPPKEAEYEDYPD